MAARQFRRHLLLGAAGLLAGVVVVPHASGADAGAKVTAIEVGILPYLPTATLIGGHEALRHHLEDTFKRPVAVSTAPDFRSFQRRVLDGEFDFTIIGPGPGRQAQLDRDHQVVAMSKQLVRVFILVRKDSRINAMTELRGQTLATIDPLTVTAQMTAAMLRDHGLTPGIDVSIRYDKVPFNTVQSLVLGEVAAASFPNVSYAKLPAEIRDKVRVLRQSEDIPGMLFMVRPAADMPTPEEFQATLFRFAETDAGRTYLQAFGHEGLIKPDPAALRALDRFVPETRRLLAAP